jgi:uncharacterized protein (TIGR03083 family)
MAEQMDKASILNELRSKYAALEAILAPLDEAQLTTPGVIGGWSIKDILAHVTAWHHRLLAWLHAAGHNEEPTISGPNSEEEMDRLNEQFYQENKFRPLADVLGDFRSSYLQIVEAVQAMPEEDLIDPRRFAWLDGDSLRQLVAGDTYDHYEEHRQQIEEWLARPN